MNNISYICGVTFAPFVPAGSFSQERARQSLRTMKDDELKSMIEYAQSLGLRVALKPAETVVKRHYSKKGQD